LFGKVHLHPCPGNLLQQPAWITKKGSALIEKYKHEVMTVHEYPPFYNGLGARTLAKRFGIPTSVEIHHIVGEPVPSSSAEYIGYWMSRLLLPFDLRFATAVRTVNHTVKEKLAGWGVDEEKIHIVPSFYLDRKALEAVQDVPKQYDLAFAARFVRNKGWSTLLKALVMTPGISVLMLGDGPDRNSAEREAGRLGLAERVSFRGWIPDQKELWSAMKEAKIFVMPSRSEGGPRVALEAMALGLPVISTNVGVMPDVVQDGQNGLFTLGDSDDLANKIQRLTGDPFLQKRMGTAAKNILNRFEKTLSIKAYADFLHSLAKPA
jgi:glycosyltransferase involved in cell wall biosynthesis